MGLKTTLKRGALIAVANWPLVAVQFVAESTLKLLLAVPVVRGVFLVVLLLGADVDQLLAGDVREIIGAVFAAMRQSTVALIAFSFSFRGHAARRLRAHVRDQGGHGVALARAEAQARSAPPLRLQAVRRASVTGDRSVPDGVPAILAALREARGRAADRLR